MNSETTKRFWSKVKKTAGCWIWTSSRRNKGYGAFVWADDAGKVIQGRAHRFSWEQKNGPIPNGLCVLHRCDNPACVNPKHLFLGTKADNNLDMLNKGRHVAGGTHCGKSGKWIHGIQHWRAIINPSIASQIRKSKMCGMSYSQIAKKFNIGITTAFKVVKGKTWK